MGIHGIYGEIGDGRRVALSKLSSELYIANDRPFRLAIDISIWLFQIQSGKGGTNPALRTFYYRLVRLLCLNIHPLFVFDGPNKPKMKRNKRVGGPGVKVVSVPEFLAKQLLKHFGFPMHQAPGEAEAECALLQREGIVDAVMSEDVDTLMFGSRVTLRKWTPEGGRSGKTPTHVTLYDADVSRERSGLDTQGMILVAMMSGGDYIPDGIPGCGPKLACEAARAGFGAELCRLRKSDKNAITEWRERLKHEIRTNESKFFKQKRTALTIPDDFPNMEVLSYYTRPAVSTPEKLQKLKDTLKWDSPIDYPALRDFAKDAFEWTCLRGATHFIRSLAPAILTRELRLYGESSKNASDDLNAIEEGEARFVKAVHGKRNHVSTDGELELRISFVPIDLINIDLSIEDPDEELPIQDSDSDIEQLEPAQDEEDDECPASPKKKRTPSNFDPTVAIKEWILATFVRIGAPLKVQDYESQFNDPRKFATRNAPKTSAPRKKAAEKSIGGMSRGALDKFAVTSKPLVERDRAKKSAEIDEIDLSEMNEPPAQSRRPVVARSRKSSKQPDIRSFSKVTKPGVNRAAQQKSREIDELDLSNVNTMSKQCPRTNLTGSEPIEEVDLSMGTHHRPEIPARRSAKRPSPDPISPQRFRNRSPPRKTNKQPEVIDLLSSSPVATRMEEKAATPPQQTQLRHLFARDSAGSQSHVFEPSLPDTVTKRKKRSAFKRHCTAPSAGEDMDTDMQQPPASLTHNTIEAMDLASPERVTVYSPGSPGSLPSPSRFHTRTTQPVAAVAKSRPAGLREESSRPITEWLPRSESVTPGRARFVDRLTQPDVVRPFIAEETAVIDLQSSMPTPPAQEIELDEADELFNRKASPKPHHRGGSVPERAEISVASLLPCYRHLRDRSATKTSSGLEDSPLTMIESECVVSTGTISQPSGSKEEEGRDIDGGGKLKSKKKKGKYIQPRESLPGAWKFVEEVDLSAHDDRSYHRSRAFRLSQVEIVDLSGD